MVHFAAILYDILTYRENFESNEFKWCILLLFYTIFWPAEKTLKSINLNGAFCRYLVRYFDLQRRCWKQWS